MAAASPVKRNAWHRQPPKSISRRSHDRHGSGIHDVPRKRLNASEFFPDRAERPIADVFKAKRRDLAGRRARQHIADRVNSELAAAPAVHARLRAIAEVVGDDMNDFDPPPQPVGRLCDDRRRLGDCSRVGISRARLRQAQP